MSRQDDLIIEHNNRIADKCIGDLKAQLAAKEQECERLKAERLQRLEQLRSYKEPGFSGDVDDPFYVEAMRIENMGFEDAHQLRDCGHSRGDYRDPEYGTPDYKGNEACVGCQRETVLKADLAEGARVIRCMVAQHCILDSDGSLLSGNLSANAEALEWLVERGEMRVIEGQGKYVRAMWAGPIEPPRRRRDAQ